MIDIRRFELKVESDFPKNTSTHGSMLTCLEPTRAARVCCGKMITNQSRNEKFWFWRGSGWRPYDNGCTASRNQTKNNIIKKETNTSKRKSSDINQEQNLWYWLKTWNVIIWQDPKYKIKPYNLNNHQRECRTIKFEEYCESDTVDFSYVKQIHSSLSQLGVKYSSNNAGDGPTVFYWREITEITRDRILNMRRSNTSCRPRELVGLSTRYREESLWEIMNIGLRNRVLQHRRIMEFAFSYEHQFIEIRCENQSQSDRITRELRLVRHASSSSWDSSDRPLSTSSSESNELSHNDDLQSWLPPLSLDGNSSLSERLENMIREDIPQWNIIHRNSEIRYMSHLITSNSRRRIRGSSELLPVTTFHHARLMNELNGNRGSLIPRLETETQSLNH